MKKNYENIREIFYMIKRHLKEPLDSTDTFLEALDNKFEVNQRPKKHINHDRSNV